MYHNDDSTELDYFMSTRETAFRRSLLKHLDAEILIDQLSYKQKAEIYTSHFKERRFPVKCEGVTAPTEMCHSILINQYFKNFIR